MKKKYIEGPSLLEAILKLDRLTEDEKINKDSSFKRGIKYDSVEDIFDGSGEYKIGLNSDLDIINSAITKTEVDFIVLARLFDIYINNRELITEDNAFITRQIWVKLKNIIEAKKNNIEELNNLSWYKKLQYYYNAYVTEEAVYKGIKDIDFVTSYEEHMSLYSNTHATDAPDFKNFIVGEMPMTLEVKNYASLDSAKKYLDSEDRQQFHNADFILVYSMAQKTWQLSSNCSNAKYYAFTNLPLQKPHINIEIDSNNIIHISEWK